MNTLIRHSELKRFEGIVDDSGRLPVLPAVDVPGDAALVIGKRGAKLSELLPELKPNHVYDVITDGHWSMNQMLAYLLSITGTARVWLSSWGVTEGPLKSVLDMVRDERISSLDLILNHRVRLQSPNAFQLLHGVRDDGRIRIHLAKIHAKLIVLHNEHHEIRVMTSANLTRNLRIETYTISTHPVLAIANRSWLDLVINGSQPFKIE